jgi:hypothetical protein
VHLRYKVEKDIQLATRFARQSLKQCMLYYDYC